jgi:hypothetical protein
MHRNPIPGVPTALLAVIALFTAPASRAADVDFSCMSLDVRGKPQVTDRYKEYDLVLQNQCPGAVYWNMCIERLDPWSQEILETLNPSGRLEAGKRTRVNLQIKPGSEEMEFHKRFQELYANAGYALEPPARAECVARSCEASKKDLRQQIQRNAKAWEAAEHELSEALVEQCPKTGWEQSAEGCEKQVRAAHQDRIESLAQKDAELRAQLKNIQPDRCTVHAGGLVPK